MRANMGLTMDLDKSRNQKLGFTMVEMLTVIAIIAILAALLLPVLTKAQLRAKRIWCENNLRQMGIAFHSFAHDHNSKFPMAVPMSDGGSLEFTENGYLIGGAFYFSYHHFQTLSNILITPRIVVCPTDTRAAAANFEIMQNSNLSYAVGADADYFKPSSILAADGNLVTPYGESPTILYDNAGARLQWTRALHQFKGNVLFADAHVEEWGDAGAANTLADAENFVLPTIMPPGIVASFNPGSPARAPSGGGSPSSGGSPATPTPASYPPASPSQPSAPAMAPPGAPHDSGQSSSANQKSAAGGTLFSDPIQVAVSLVKTNPAVVSVTNEPVPIPEPAVVSHPKPNLVLKLVGWSFLLLLLLLLLLLYLAYQVWQNTRKANDKKPRRSQ